MSDVSSTKITESEPTKLNVCRNFQINPTRIQKNTDLFIRKRMNNPPPHYPFWFVSNGPNYPLTNCNECLARHNEQFAHAKENF